MDVNTSRIRDVTGVGIGHDTNEHDRTGCTVIAFDQLTLSAAEVRGSAPGTRELDLLQPGRSVQHADAILLTGGSAFGLRAADGVVAGLAERGRGFPTPAGAVPIVPAAVIYDLESGNAVAPDAEAGRRALERATPFSQVESGQVGAGTGARVGMIGGPDAVRPGGCGIAQIAVHGGTVTAVVVLNAFGMFAGDLDGDEKADPRRRFIDALAGPPDVPFGRATTLMAVITDVTCDHDTLIRCCVAAHDGLARIIVPAHTAADGDVAFASALREGPIDRQTAMTVTMASELAIEAALRQAATAPVI